MQRTLEGADVHFMRVALCQAEEALLRSDWPIGAALVIDGHLIGAASNRNTTNKSWIAHAEINVLLAHATAIRQSVETRGARVELFTTLEPCLMCLAMASFCRISRIVFAMRDPKQGAVSGIGRINDLAPRNFPVVEGGILEEESKMLIEKYQPRYPFEEPHIGG
jgi:tRNA(adenine34) deaminase